MAMLCFVFLICSVRTNIVFVIIFLTLVLCLGLITGAYWALASDYVGNALYAGRLLVVSDISDSTQLARLIMVPGSWSLCVRHNRLRVVASAGHDFSFGRLPHQPTGW